MCFQPGEGPLPSRGLFSELEINFTNICFQLYWRLETVETNPSSWHLCVSGQWGLANMDIGPRLRTTASNNCQAPVYSV